ncbi:uncharacterized protein LOC135206218 [Macrobrachium nipponense]|uniref:uncharacterized protein LOC135206218 n=1 Tax=Macrobrachium nipponense TaxID=159736 RepID=UPI0030C8B71F
MFLTRMEYLWILLFCVVFSDAYVCQVNITAGEEGSGEGLIISGGGNMGLMTCPGPLDPENHTHCCYTSEDSGAKDGKTGHDHSNNGVARCCAPQPQPVGVYMDDRTAMIIALTVTAVCVIITIIIIICCFWSRCPLYTACRIRYHQDDIIAYASKDEETAGLNDMPPEETKGVTIYSPNAVKVTLKDDV